MSNIFRENWICGESEHLNINYDILCYPNRLMSLKCFNKRHITLAFYESHTNLVACHNRGTAGCVREVVLEKELTIYVQKRGLLLCKIFLRFKPRAASLKLVASVANPKKRFCARKL